MSIVLEGVDMPKGCAGCLISRYDDGYRGGYGYGTQGYICRILKRYTKQDECPADCPLIPLPQKHGRLIDADRLLRKCQKVSTQAWKMKLHADVEITMNQFIDFVKQAPTITEAEDGE